ncbi:hypothetical protein QUA41_03680 [Microcoleus sp. Pol11C1]|uniref:hypothetical protein n=1 Tax=Microcoleus sp. POL1_C1 TaxID=2818870 RepID=UPI002FD22443
MSSLTDAYSVSPVYEVQYGDGSALSRRELIDKRVYFINLQPVVYSWTHFKVIL